jgi:hypothetical protein
MVLVQSTPAPGARGAQGRRPRFAESRHRSDPHRTDFSRHLDRQCLSPAGRPGRARHSGRPQQGWHCDQPGCREAPREGQDLGLSSRLSAAPGRVDFTGLSGQWLDGPAKPGDSGGPEFCDSQTGVPQRRLLRGLPRGGYSARAIAAGARSSGSLLNAPQRQREQFWPGAQGLHRVPAR